MRHFNKILLGIFVLSCHNLFSQNTWSNADQQKIGEWQDTRNTKELLKSLSSKDEKLRYLSARAFGSLQDTLAIPVLLKMLKNDASVKVKISATYALGQYRRTALCNTLIKQYGTEKNKTVRAYLLESIGKSADSNAIQFFINVNLNNPKNKPDSLLSLYFGRGVYFAFRNKIKSEKLPEKLRMLNDELKQPYLDWVYQQVTTIRKAPNQVVKKAIEDDVCMDSLNTMSGPYQKVKFLEAHTVSSSLYLKLAFSDEGNFLKSYCLEQYLTGRNIETALLKKCMESKNLAFIAMAAEKIRKDSLWWPTVDNIQYIKKIQQGLTMPQDYEAWVELEKTICNFQHTKYAYKAPDLNHPINWVYVQKLKEIEKVRIVTSKGIMEMSCYVNEAPGSVANFLQLVETGFYNNKFFHRMVPDFVVQGGCPRGDGWGALNWTQRSEFSPELNYKKGSVGLASAGKDSEGVQFFITHGYTSSLDGRYTIFGEITKGLEIIELLQVGDMIKSIERIP